METFGDLSVALDTVLLRKSQRPSQEGQISSEIRRRRQRIPFRQLRARALGRVFGVGSSLGLVAQLVRARA